MINKKNMKKNLKVIILIVVGILIGLFIGFKLPKSADLNNDGVVDKLDFSIMMNQWTK